MKEKRKITFTTKSKKKKFIIFKFFTIIKKLRVPDFVLDDQFFQNKNWLFDENQKLSQYYIKLFKYNKDNYQDEDKITN